MIYEGFKIAASAVMIDALKKLCPEQSAVFSISNIPLQMSSLFPFELTYDACDIESKMEVKIPSGEWIHGIVMPEVPDFIDTKPTMEFAPTFIEEDTRNNFLNSFMFKGRVF